MENVTITALPLSGVIRVFDNGTQSVMFTGTEDVIPDRIRFQIPEKIYSVDDVTYIDVTYQKVYYDTEADWYYYESFFRSQYDEHSQEEKEDQSFDQFMAETLKYEPIYELT